VTETYILMPPGYAYGLKSWADSLIKLQEIRKFGKREWSSL